LIFQHLIFAARFPELFGQKPVSTTFDYARRSTRLPTEIVAANPISKLHKFMAECSPTAGIHLIVAQRFVTKNKDSPLRAYAVT
jgi:hypothetical protein